MQNSIASCPHGLYILCYPEFLSAVLGQFLMVVSPLCPNGHYILDQQNAPFSTTIKNMTTPKNAYSIFVKQDKVKWFKYDKNLCIDFLKM